MKVSVIVPVYNVEKYIDKCLDSLVNQTLKDIEIIVVNDGSPDNSQKIINKYVKKYPKKVKSYIKENGGQGSARNFGFEKASGKYIGYVDSDDYVEIDMFEKMYNKAELEKLDIVICGSYNVHENGKRTVDLDRKLFSDCKKNAFFGRMAVWNKLYRREILSDIKFRSKVWYEDLDFTLKAISNSNSVGYCNEPLYYYLIREGSTMNNNNLYKNLDILDAFDQVNNYLILKEYKSIIEFLAVDHIFISSKVRIINSTKYGRESKLLLKKIDEYMFLNYKNFFSNEYLCLLPRNRKIIYLLMKHKFYLLIKFMFKLKGKK